MKESETDKISNNIFCLIKTYFSSSTSVHGQRTQLKAVPYIWPYVHKSTSLFFRNQLFTAGANPAISSQIDQTTGSTPLFVEAKLQKSGKCPNAEKFIANHPKKLGVLCLLGRGEWISRDF